MASDSMRVDLSFNDTSYVSQKYATTPANIERYIAIQPKAKKLKAIVLAVFLGHFGVHRIYLGSTPNVPVVYSLTLGGGFGLLPLLDIVAILTSKDLEQYANNNKVFMWSKSK